MATEAARLKHKTSYREPQHFGPFLGFLLGGCRQLRNRWIHPVQQLQ